jgi:hypothetical protein
LYGLPLSLLAWAQKWIDPHTPTERLWHHVCGRETSPVLACGTCGVAVRRQDIGLGSRRADVMTDLTTARQTAMNAERCCPTGAHAGSS